MTRTLAAGLLALSLAACGGSKPVSLGEDSDALVCRDIAAAASSFGLNSTPPPNPGVVMGAASTIRMRAAAATSADLRRAGTGYADAMTNFRMVLESGDLSQRQIADGTLRRAAQPVADLCGIPLPELVN